MQDKALTGKNIFIVEDNTANRVVYQVLIKRSKANATFDHWGQDSLQVLQELETVDLIILDLMLGAKTSGFDIFGKIRKIEKYNTTPIVAISAADPIITIPKTREHGFDGFIAKPIEEEHFIAQLTRLLNGEKIWYAGERYGYRS